MINYQEFFSIGIVKSLSILIVIYFVMYFTMRLFKIYYMIMLVLNARRIIFNNKQYYMYDYIMYLIEWSKTRGLNYQELTDNELSDAKKHYIEECYNFNTNNPLFTISKVFNFNKISLDDIVINKNISKRMRTYLVMARFQKRTSIDIFKRKLLDLFYFR